MSAAPGDDDAEQDSVGQGSDLAQQLSRGSPTTAEGPGLRSVSGDNGADSARSTFRCEAGASEDAAAFRLGRHLRKKLQQIEALEQRCSAGGPLDEQQVLYSIFLVSVIVLLKLSSWFVQPVYRSGSGFSNADPTEQDAGLVMLPLTGEVQLDS